MQNINTDMTFEIVDSYQIAELPFGGVDVEHKPGSKTVGSLSLEPATVARTLAAVATLLVVASVGLQLLDYATGYSSLLVHKLVKLFDLDLEVNVPTFFSVGILLMASALLTGITVFKRRLKERYIVEWAILAAGFLFMAFDEMASVHERLIEPMREMLGISSLGFLYYAWVVPAFFVVGVLGVFFLRFLIKMPSLLRYTFILAAGMYLGGSMGLELFEGVYGTENLPYIALVTAEEYMEMGGVIIFIWALLGYIRDNFEGIKLTLLGGDDKRSFADIEPAQEFIF